MFEFLSYVITFVACWYFCSGVIRLGDDLMLGPDQDGQFQRILVMGLRRNRLPCRMIRAGQVATIALPSIQRCDVHHVCTVCVDVE